MQVGVDAIADVVAPPPRASTGNATAASNAKSFDDHLADVRAEPPSRPEPKDSAKPEEPNAPTREQQTNSSADDTDRDDGSTAVVATSTPQPSPSLLIQIAATLAPGETQADEANAEAVQEPPPSAAAPEPTDAPPAPVIVAAANSNPQQAKAQSETSAPPTAKSNATHRAAHAHGAHHRDAAAAVQANADATAAASAQTKQNADARWNANASLPTPEPSASPQPAATAPLVRQTIASDTSPKSDSRAAKHDPGSTQASAPITPNDNKRTEAKAAPAPKTAAPNSTPTAAPRESFTALLGQQDSAPAPQVLQSLSAAAPSSIATPAATVAQTAAAAAPAAQIGREIIRRFNGEHTRFEVRLDPPELGRIEVKLEVSRDHRVTAIVAADNPQALAELTRHARELEQALQSAGLELSDDGLRFDLSDRREQSGEAASSENRADSSRNQASHESETAAQAPRRLSVDAWRGVRVDVMA